MEYLLAWVNKLAMVTVSYKNNVGLRKPPVYAVSIGGTENNITLKNNISWG